MPFVVSRKVKVPCVGVWVLVCVCVFVCLRSYLLNCKSDLHHITYGHGSVLIWRRSNTFCTSGFMDDVIFAHKPRLLDVAALATNCAQ